MLFLRCLFLRVIFSFFSWRYLLPKMDRVFDQLGDIEDEIRTLGKRDTGKGGVLAAKVPLVLKRAAGVSSIDNNTTGNIKFPVTAACLTDIGSSLDDKRLVRTVESFNIRSG